MRVVACDGLTALTMQSVADEVGCAIGTIYTHFPSKGHLVADLQNAAVLRLIGSLQDLQERSTTILDLAEVDDLHRSATAVVLYGEFYIAAWDAFPEESHLLFSVMTEKGEVVPASELGRVFGTAVVLLMLGRDTLDAAVEAGAVAPGPSMDRVIIGAACLLGTLLTSHVGHVDPVAFDHRRLTRSAWRTLLDGWGMTDEVWAAAAAHVTAVAEAGPLAADPAGLPE